MPHDKILLLYAQQIKRQAASDLAQLSIINAAFAGGKHAQKIARALRKQAEH